MLGLADPQSWHGSSFVSFFGSADPGARPKVMLMFSTDAWSLIVTGGVLVLALLGVVIIVPAVIMTEKSATFGLNARFVTTRSIHR